MIRKKPVHISDPFPARTATVPRSLEFQNCTIWTLSTSSAHRRLNRLAEPSWSSRSANKTNITLLPNRLDPLGATPGKIESSLVSSRLKHSRRSAALPLP